MRKYLVGILRKYPGLYTIAEGIYSFFRIIQYKLSGSKTAEKYWAERKNKKGNNDWNDNDDDWIRDYWNSVDHPHRKYLIEIIAGYNPSSILEIGCNCGPNLRLLAKRFPDAEIRGIDINPTAVEKGNEWLKQEGISNVRLFDGNAGGMLRIDRDNFDVVFADALLIYVGPDKIKTVVETMLALSGKVLILLEWNDFNSGNNKPGVFKRHWVRNYKSLLNDFAVVGETKVTKLPNEAWPDKNWQEYGAIIEATIKSNDD